MEESDKKRIARCLGEPLHDWWVGLESDKASRAILRRCATLDQVILSSAYQRFYRYMLAHRWPENALPWQCEKLAVVAGLMPHVELDDATPGTQQLPLKVKSLSDDKLLFSEMRFRDLLKVDTNEDLFISLRRALSTIKGKASIEQLAKDVFAWDDEVKKRWAYSYPWPLKQAS